MVVIEPVPISSSRQEEDPQTASSTTTPTVENRNASLSSTTAAESGFSSDGYETASDSEFNNSENDELNGNNTDITNIHGNNDEARRDNQNQVQPKDDKRALAQANEAKLEGNALFKEGQYEEAILKYELALQVGSDMPSSVELRSICHANRGACFSKLGKHKETILECTKALELNPSYAKALIRRAEAYEKLENYAEAIADMTKVLELDPSYDQARRTIIRLRPLAQEKLEKMKKEMIGTLKEVGNSLLGRFGMSCDNFKAVKDPKTGSYSLSFQR